MVGGRGWGFVGGHDYPMVMVVKMKTMMRGVVCVRERVKERERQRDSKYQKHSSLSKCKSTITQRLNNDRQREENRWYTYIHTPCYLSQNLQYAIPYYLLKSYLGWCAFLVLGILWKTRNLDHKQALATLTSLHLLMWRCSLQFDECRRRMNCVLLHMHMLCSL